MIDFKKIAQDNTSLCPVMSGRKKLDTSDVIGKELTIIEFGFAPKFDKSGNPVIDNRTGEIDTFAVVVFSEAPDCYYSAGTVLTKVCKAWAVSFDGDSDEASYALAESGGVRVRIYEARTRAGNNLTAVDILD